MTERQCGDCQLCCKLLPVLAVEKPGNCKCKYQKHGVGCTIYKELEVVSPECRLWNCAWRVNDAGQLARPDRSHIVIDVMPDYVGIPDPDTGKVTNIPAVQIWIDPKHKDAHRDPELRAYLDQRGQRDGACAIIRYSPSEGFVLLPPSLTGGEWVENHTPPTERTHSVSQIMEVLRQ